MKRYIVATSVSFNKSKSYFFVDHITRVFTTTEGNTAISGCNNNGYIEVKESVEEILKQIDNLK